MKKFIILLGFFNPFFLILFVNLLITCYFFMKKFILEGAYRNHVNISFRSDY